MFCVLGCRPTRQLFSFPSLKESKRRKLWLDFFDMEEPNIVSLFACENHFSSLQFTPKGLRKDAVPDIPIICSTIVHPFKRKSENWRTNVIVVTPRDPEFIIYRHETGIFPQNLFNNIETARPPAIKMPVISTISCSMSTQTNTRLCGLVEISVVKEEYRLNCFYCSEVFPIAKWSMFVNHLKTRHYEAEEAFKMSKYISVDHEYTSACPPNSAPPNKVSKSIINMPPPPPPPPVYQQHNILPTPLPTTSHKLTDSPTTVLKTSEIIPSTLASKLPKTNGSAAFNISVADQVIQLLNETLLSPKFLQTEDDNILVVKNTGSSCIETSKFLEDLVHCDRGFIVSPKKTKSQKSKLSTSSSKHTRAVYTIGKGQQEIPSGRNSLAHQLFPPLPKDQKAKLTQKKIAQETLKNIDVFESVYKTVKKRYPTLVETTTDRNNPNASKVRDQETSKLTPLSRCLKRTNSEAVETVKKVPKTSTEIVFQYTSRDIVFSLLENMENFPVLWEFHDEPFNKGYTTAIETLCRTINNKWAINITLIKMRRSLQRILRYYRYMLTCEKIEEFMDYYDKCIHFLPSSVEAIPRARCIYCCICFRKDIDLRKHILVRHNAIKWPYKCLKCFERFREADEYELHQRLPHYKEKLKCQICNREFKRRHLYNNHLATHVKLKEPRMEAPKRNTLCVPCDVCGRKFTSYIHLGRHKEFMHTGQGPKCPLCSKEFNKPSILAAHMKIHNKQFDYMCEVCGKGFIKKSSLTEHMQKHTGAKVTCNICNIKLRKCNLMRHLRLVHIVTEGTIESAHRAKSHRYRPRFGPFGRRRAVTPRHYDCKICKIPFERLKQLKDHNKEMHFDVKTISCRLCTVEFRYIPNLRRHYRYKHKLHIYQIFLLLDKKQDLNKVLAMKQEELDSMSPDVLVSLTQNNVKSENFSEEETMRSDEIQDEIMKAVENLDKQEIKVDDDHSMHDFFKDLLK